MLCYIPFSSRCRCPQGSGQGHFSVPTHLLGHITQSCGFKCPLYVDVSKTYIFEPWPLFPPNSSLTYPTSYLIPQLGFLKGISILTHSKKKPWFLPPKAAFLIPVSPFLVTVLIGTRQGVRAQFQEFLSSWFLFLPSSVTSSSPPLQALPPKSPAFFHFLYPTNSPSVQASSGLNQRKATAGYLLPSTLTPEVYVCSA